jgi:NADH:ubiquinone oxidoreductase subunit 6 (subunit J)
MVVSIPAILSVIISFLNTAKISHLILSLQGVIICLISTVFIQTNSAYLSYAFIYVYVGAICVLFLYFMILLQKHLELTGNNSFYGVIELTIIEVIVLILAYTLASERIFVSQGQEKNEDTFTVKQVCKCLIGNPGIMWNICVLLLIGVILPILITKDTKKILVESTKEYRELIEGRIIPTKKIIELKSWSSAIMEILGQILEWLWWSTPAPTATPPVMEDLEVNEIIGEIFAEDSNDQRDCNEVNNLKKDILSELKEIDPLEEDQPPRLLQLYESCLKSKSKKSGHLRRPMDVLNNKGKQRKSREYYRVSFRGRLKQRLKRRVNQGQPINPNQRAAGPDFHQDQAQGQEQRQGQGRPNANPAPELQNLFREFINDPMILKWVGFGIIIILAQLVAPTVYDIMHGLE